MSLVGAGMAQLRALDDDRRPRSQVKPTDMPLLEGFTEHVSGAIEAVMPGACDPHAGTFDLGPRRERRERERLALNFGCCVHGRDCPLLT